MKNFYNDYVSQIVNHPAFFWFLGGIGLCFVLYIIAACFRHRGVKVYRDESGRSIVTRKALRDLVRIACGNLDTAQTPKIDITPKRGRFDLTIRVKLYEGQKLNVLRDHIRRSIIHTFEEIHGIRLGDINVLVTGFKKSAHSPVVDEITEEESKETLPEVNPEPPASEDASSAPEKTPEVYNDPVMDEFDAEDVSKEEPEAEKTPWHKRLFSSKKSEPVDEELEALDAAGSEEKSDDKGLQVPEKKN